MAFLAGLDKFTNLLVDWERYISPIALQMLPFAPSVFMAIVGVVEIMVGLAILTVQPVLGAYAASGWLVIITLNLVLAGYLDIAVRDLVLAVSAYTLGQILQVDGTGPTM
jgi:hypothetical protein